MGARPASADAVVGSAWADGDMGSALAADIAVAEELEALKIKIRSLQARVDAACHSRWGQVSAHCFVLHEY